MASNVLASMVATLGWDVDNSGLDSTGAELDKLESKAISLGDVLKFALAAVGSKYILDQNIAYEAQAAALTTVLGSADAAADAIQRLSALANEETSFGADAIIATFTKLELRAMDSSDRAIKGLGNVAAAFGRNVEEVVDGISSAARGVSAGLEGILGADLVTVGDKWVFELKGVRYEVEKDARAIQELLIGLGETEFSLGMEAQANTLGGVLSIMKGAIDGLAVAFGQAFSADVRESLSEVVGAVGGLGPLAEKAGLVVGALFRTVARGISFVVALDLPGRADRLLERLGGVERITVLLQVALAALGGVAVIRGIMAAVTAVRALGTAAALAQIKLYAIGAVFVAVGLIIEDFVAFLRGENSLIGEFVDKFSGEESFFGSLARGIIWVRDVGLPAMTRFFKAIGAAWSSQDTALGKYFEAVRRTFSWIVTNGGAAVAYIWGKFNALWNWMAGSIAQTRERIDAFLDGFRNGADGAAEGVIGTFQRVGSVIGGIVDVLRGVWAAYFSYVIGTFATIAGAAAKAASWLGDAVGFDVSSVQEFADNMDALKGRQAASFVDAAGSLGSSAARAVGLSGGGNVTSSVGEVNVTIAGTTGMGSSEVSAAVARGVRGGIGAEVTQLGRFAKGGL